VSPAPRDIYVRDLCCDTIKPKTRDFRWGKHIECAQSATSGCRSSATRAMWRRNSAQPEAAPCAPRDSRRYRRDNACSPAVRAPPREQAIGGSLAGLFRSGAGWPPARRCDELIKLVIRP
jgi:hypothetical protein